MSEKIELIPAAELPVAESDDVEALVIEGGELKRKEAGGEVRSVNGIKPDEHGNVEVSGGGIPTHYIYRVSDGAYNDEIIDCIYSDGLYDALENFWNNNVPCVLMLFMFIRGEISVNVPRSIARDDYGVYNGYCFDDSYHWYVHPDGLATIEYDN